MNNKGNNSSSFDWKKIVGIVAAVLVVAALIVSLVSCQKKKSNSDKPKERRVEDKGKKPKKKDDKKLDVVDNNSGFVVNSNFTVNKSSKVSNLSNKTSGSGKTPEKVVKYDTEVTLNGDSEIALEYKEESYNEEGAKYTNKKNNIIVSNGDVSDIKIYNDGQEVDSLTIDSPVGQYSVVYSYTNPDGETLTATRTVTIQDTTAPTIAYTKAVEGNSAVYTITVTDNSEIGSVDVDGTALTATNNQYKFTATANGSYTVTAKDIYENTSTETLTVSELITDDELDGALTVGNVTGSSTKRRTITRNGADNVRYAYTYSDHSDEVTTSTFKNPETGQYNNPVTIDGDPRTVTTVNGNSTQISNSQGRNHYYVYYEVSKTTGDYTATASTVKHVTFN